MSASCWDVAAVPMKKEIVQAFDVLNAAIIQVMSFTAEQGPEDEHESGFTFNFLQQLCT